jgi:predicted dithiol-disulfide oxidoreductase (DUF899 family)
MNTSAENGRKGGQPAMHTPPVVSPQAWEAARKQLLVKEKAQTRARDALAAERRRMPWMAVETAYAFEGPAGKASLLDLFDGRRQLIDPVGLHHKADERIGQYASSESILDLLFS